MNTVDDHQKNDPFVGYFASVALALLASRWCSSLFVEQLVKVTPLESPMGWQVNIAAGLFLGITFSNLVGALIRRANPMVTMIRFVIGFMLGVVTQYTVFTPIAGHYMSGFLLLLLAGLIVFVILMVSQVREFFDQQGIVMADRLATLVLRVLSWPRRVQFVLMMGASYALFWRYTNGVNQIMLILAVLLMFLTIYVSLREPPVANEDMDPHEIERRSWLTMEVPLNDNQTVVDQAVTSTCFTVKNLLPGAILFAGMTRLAVAFLTLVYPNLQMGFEDPMSSIKTIAIIATSGLAVVFFGMMSALGFGLGALRLVAIIRHWSDQHLRANCVQLIRLMYFRPIDRT